MVNLKIEEDPQIMIMPQEDPHQEEEDPLEDKDPQEEEDPLEEEEALPETLEVWDDIPSRRERPSDLEVNTRHQGYPGPPLMADHHHWDHQGPPGPQGLIGPQGPPGLIHQASAGQPQQIVMDTSGLERTFQGITGVVNPIGRTTSES